MLHTELILVIAVGLGAALVLGYVTQRLGLSPIVGYLVAGVVVGPLTPGFVIRADIAQRLAEIGVILLMFGVGLQFHVEELLSTRRIAVPGVLAATSAATLLGGLAARAYGWNWTSSLVFGLALSVSSTVVLVRVLSDTRRLHTPTGHIAIGWLVMEDVLTIAMLVLLPSIVTGRLTSGELVMAIAVTLLKMAGLVALAVVVGQRVIPAVLDRVAETRSRELFTLSVLVIALGIAAGSAYLFGVSIALGAFVAGMVVNRSEYSLRAATDALPMRDAFAVLFFLSVGMLLDPFELLGEMGLAVLGLLVVIVGKPLVAALVLWLRRYPVHVVLTVPSALAQTGEFSFILAAVGRDVGVLPDMATNIVVAVSIASILINPFAVRLIAHLERWLATRALRTGRAEIIDRFEESGASSSLDPQSRAVVIGYGPTGRTVARLLRENGIAPTIVELNMDTVRMLRDSGMSSVYGDARHADTLVSAGVRHAGTMIVSGADPHAPETIRVAREINPHVHVLSRAVYLRDVPPLRQAGSEQVFSGEGEVALAMTEAVLRQLGATPDQIDRERARVREELFGET